MTEGETLCRACGMCCDGSLFGRAGLELVEVPAARKNRLVVVANEGSFEQSCAAFAGGACSIYDGRPRSCRRFVCRLHERLRTEGGALDRCLARVRRARELLVQGEPSAELTLLMDEDFARA